MSHCYDHLVTLVLQILEEKEVISITITIAGWKCNNTRLTGGPGKKERAFMSCCDLGNLDRADRCLSSGMDYAHWEGNGKK
jgi:hypothetical protein